MGLRRYALRFCCSIKSFICSHDVSVLCRYVANMASAKHVEKEPTMFETLRFECRDHCTPKSVLALISGKILGDGDVEFTRIEAACTLEGEMLEWMYVEASACASTEDICVQFTAEAERSGMYVDVKVLGVEFYSAQPT